MRSLKMHSNNLTEDNIVQEAKKIFPIETALVCLMTSNTALIDRVRKFAMGVRELDIDLIDRINPFGESYRIHF